MRPLGGLNEIISVPNSSNRTVLSGMSNSRAKTHCVIMRGAHILRPKRKRHAPMMKTIFWLLTAAIIGSGIWIIFDMQAASGM